MSLPWWKGREIERTGGDSGLFLVVVAVRRRTRSKKRNEVRRRGGKEVELLAGQRRSTSVKRRE